MQNVVFSILLLVLTEGVLTKVVTTSKKQLPAPFSTSVTTFDPPGMIIEWSPVSSDLIPVLGYKVRVWEAQGRKVYSISTVNGERVVVDKVEVPQLADFKPGDGKLYEYNLAGADQSRLIINGIKLETPYLYQVLAYGTNGDGETSGYAGFQLHGNDTQNSM